MTSKKPGKNTSRVEVTHVSTQGLWVLVESKEYFLSYSAYPWFSEAKLSDVMNVELLHGHHLRWPALDVDIEIDSLNYPEKYPLVYRPTGRARRLAVQAV
jgi:hypothetical protein